MALPASDSFTDTNGTALTAHSASWTNQTAASAFVINANSLAPNNATGGVELAAHWNADAFNADQYSQCVVAANGGNGGVGVGVRHAAAGTQSYYMWYGDNTATYFAKIVGGVWTQFGSNGTPLANGDVLRIEAAGTSITAKRNGATFRAQTDSALTGGRAGVAGWGQTTLQRIDDWEGGNLGGGTFTGSAAVNLPAITASGSGTFTAPTYTGSATPSLPALTAAATGTFVALVYTGTAAISLPVVDADSSGTFVAPIYTGTAAVSLVALGAAGSGIFDEGVFTGIAAFSLPGLTAAASGAFAVPVYTGQAALSLAALSLAGAGTFAVPVYMASAAFDLPALAVDGSGDFASAVYAGDGDFSLPALDAAASGTFAEFVFRALKSALHNAIGIRF